MSRYRVGVIGCGSVGTKRHIPGWQKESRTDLVSVFDRNLDKARNTAKKQDIEHYTSSEDEFFDLDLDVISICTPPFTHAEMAIKGLKAGSNILCEKPLATSRQETEKILEKVNETGLNFGTVHNFLYSNSMQKAKRKISNGDIGSVQNVLGYQTSSPARDLPSWYPKLPGGLFFDESPHLLYLIESLLGDLSIDSMSAQTNERDRQPIKMLNGSLFGDNSQMGALTMVFNAPLSEWYLTIIGTDGVLVIDIFRDILLEFDREPSHSPRQVLSTSFTAIQQEISGIAKSGYRNVTGDLLFGTGELINRYVNALECGGDPPVTAEDGARIVDLILTIIEDVELPTEYPREFK